MPESQKRQIAYKTKIRDILEGKYIKEEGWQPNYIITKDGREISRINVIGIVISTDFQSAVIDDGSGIITIRSFNEDQSIKNLNVGNILLVIGRPREFQDQKYIMPEIIKQIENEKWIKLRKMELEMGKSDKEDKKIKKIPEIIEEPEIIKVVKEETNSEKVYNLIKKLDKGEGIEFDKVITKSSIKEAEEIIKNLLKEGEVFQNKPGKLKVLE